MDNNLKSAQGIPARISGNNALKKVLGFFGPKSDITYKLIENATIKDVDLKQSLLTGTILRKCTFDSVNFSRSDMDGIRIENSFFENCDFRIVDFRSAVLAHSKFSNCQFDNTFIYDCLFDSCELENCTFLNASLTNSSFKTCHFFSCNFRQLTFLLNDIFSTIFEGMTLGDCTFLYVIIKDCTFKNIAINIESIGMIYGLGEQDISNFDFVYLGEKLASPEHKNLVKSLFKEYELRKWHIGLATMRLNFGISSPVYAIKDYFDTLRSFRKKHIIIKKDELLFVSKILDELAYSQKLPLMSVMDSFETVVEIIEGIEESKKTEDIHSVNALKQIANSLIEKIHQMTQEFNQQRIQIENYSGDYPVKVSISFVKKPNLKIDDFLNGIATASGLQIRSQTHTVAQHEGSYIETLSTTIHTLFALQIALFLLNGCVIQVTELKARYKIMLRKQLPSTYLKKALQPKQEIPSYLITSLRNIFRHLTPLVWLNDPDLNGLSSKNIKEIAIDPKEK